MNVISFGENEVSWEALKLTSDKYQLLPLISKYNFALLISSALKFVVSALFWSNELLEFKFKIFCWTCIVFGEQFTTVCLDPLKNAFI